jgi:hypothetical protein
MLTIRLDCQRFNITRLDCQRFNITRSSITANTTVITTANTGPTPPMDEVGMDEAIAEEALVEDPVEVNSRMEPDIDKGSD